MTAVHHGQTDSSMTAQILTDKGEVVSRKINIHGSYGKIEYRPVGSPVPYMLTEVDDLQLFAKAVVSAVKQTIK